MFDFLSLIIAVVALIVARNAFNQSGGAARAARCDGSEPVACKAWPAAASAAGGA